MAALKLSSAYFKLSSSGEVATAESLESFRQGLGNGP
jgi:hypothetical protein